MRSVIIGLAILFLLLQYKLWVPDGGVPEAWRLRNDVQKQAQKNNELHDRNARLLAEIKDLRQGKEAVEARARRDLGMVRKGEVFYQYVK